MSWADYQHFLDATVAVCRKRKNLRVDGKRFSADAYNPPTEMGLPAQLFTVQPALHGYNATGQREHIYSEGFMFVFNLN